MVTLLPGGGNQAGLDCSRGRSYWWAALAPMVGAEQSALACLDQTEGRCGTDAHAMARELAGNNPAGNAPVPHPRR